MPYNGINGMGTYSLGDALTVVKSILRDTTALADARLLSDDEIVNCIHRAENRYSEDKPREKVYDITGDATAWASLPEDYIPEFSAIIRMESPIDNTPPSWVDSRDYILTTHGANSTPKIRWTRVYPAVGEIVRLYYYTDRFYGAAANGTTILDKDHFALCDLAVSYCAADIGNKYARAHEPILGADTVDYGARGQNWVSISEHYLKRYEDAVGDGVKYGSSFLNWDVQPFPTRDYLFHRKMSR
jgi:hypothetical protein